MPTKYHRQRCNAAQRILTDVFERLEPVIDETERSMFEELEAFIVYAQTECRLLPARRSPFHHHTTLGPRKP